MTHHVFIALRNCMKQESKILISFLKFHKCNVRNRDISVLQINILLGICIQRKQYVKRKETDYEFRFTKTFLDTYQEAKTFVSVCVKFAGAPGKGQGTHMART